MQSQEQNIEISIYLSRLSALMIRNQITQNELARITNIRQATISDYLKGKSIPSIERFARIADAFGVWTANSELIKALHELEKAGKVKSTLYRDMANMEQYLIWEVV